VKTSTLIDTNILMDVWGPPDTFSEWSKSTLVACRVEGELVVNEIVWSEIAPTIRALNALESSARMLSIRREHLSWEAAFAAGMAHARYRRSGGARERTLPDFLIGAHAATAGHRLLTRDPGRYRKYFPDLSIIAPDTHP
jgi:predicted nucleic acid-binding protein